MTDRELIYLGWQGFHNFGDDLLHETWKLALRQPLTVTAPLGRDYLRRAAGIVGQRARSPRRERLVLLGGGTTVGFDNWGRHLRRAMTAFGARGAVIAGAGVCASTDTDQLAAQPQNWRRWRRLNTVTCLGLRGPMSADEAARNWRSTDVIGDPALLYPLVAPVMTRDIRPGIGIALGAGGLSRFDIDQVVAVAERHAGVLGCDITVFELAAEDAAITEALCARLRLRPRVVRYAGDVADVMAEISTCALMISERLHGAVAAVALGVPTVSLSYASKCRDFLSSVDAEYATVAPGEEADLDEVVGMVLTTESRERTRAATQSLQQRLAEAAGAITGWLDGDDAALAAMSDAASH